jgi:hypothetical protein
MYRRFEFEGDIHVSLDCVPLVVRRKLDLAELKISLAGWQALTRAERLALCHLPVDTDEELVVRGFAARAAVELSPLQEPRLHRAAWSSAAVCARLRARLGADHDPGERVIDGLTEEERYAIFKLAEPKREPAKLVALLGELGIGPGSPA